MGWCPNFPPPKCQILLFVCALMSCLPLCHGYAAGAPAQVCGDMFPHHGHDSQTTPAPYTITVDTMNYHRGQDVRVTLTANSPTEFFFEGFFLQARRADCQMFGQAVGTFKLTNSNDSEVALKTCQASNDAVSHTTSAHKTSKTFIWNNSEGQDVFFQATFVNHKHTFWSNVQSEVVHDMSLGVRITHARCEGRTKLNMMLTHVTASGASVSCSVLLVSGLALFAKI
ncbi:putative ferric-chelate reductase 1 isoform X2 [Haliotis rufescens]|uniref:putative ferric-chelate reductase 1 isoform X2 n=1 Tax=Haliotis rufescens TaxID=6454 RepID=UPI00201F15D6|nr:putative ferric-chelate reductase 1 isoform X2 [Haliotis rufescens]